MAVPTPQTPALARVERERISFSSRSSQFPGKLKLGGLLCLLLIAAPLRSLYLLIWPDPARGFSLYPQDGDHLDFADESDGSRDIEHLLRVLIHESIERRGMVDAPLLLDSLAAATANSSSARIDQIRILLPWFLSVALAFIGANLLAVRERLIIRDEGLYLASLSRKKRRLAKIRLCLRGFRRVIRENDIRPAVSGVCSANEDGAECHSHESIERRGMVDAPLLLDSLAAATANSSSARIDQIRILLPWFLSVALAFIGANLLAVRERLIIRDEGLYLASLSRKKRRLAKIRLCLRGFRRVIRENDIRPAVSGVCSANEDGAESLVLPVPGKCITAATEQSHTRDVAAICAICLSNYMVGSVAVWSSNSNCQHVFHEKCIVSWFVKNRERQCPCCRQHFVAKDLLKL